MASRRARFAEFLKRLAAAPPACTAEEASALLARTLEQVEDEMAATRRSTANPASWRDDGRMYPPQPDSARSVPGHPELTRYRSRAHNSWIATNGAIRISEVSGGAVVLDKSGADGCKAKP